MLEGLQRDRRPLGDDVQRLDARLRSIPGAAPYLLRPAPIQRYLVHLHTCTAAPQETVNCLRLLDRWFERRQSETTTGATPLLSIDTAVGVKPRTNCAESEAPDRHQLSNNDGGVCACGQGLGSEWIRV